MEPPLEIPAGWLPRDTAHLDAYLRDMLTGRHATRATTGQATPPLRLALGVVTAVTRLVVGLALHGYILATMTPLHPDAQAVTSVAHAAPARPWAGAVAQARHVVRAALAEQNLPGVSVAVGAGDDLVWAEGFGWANLEQRLPVAPETRFRIGTASSCCSPPPCSCSRPR